MNSKNTLQLSLVENINCQVFVRVSGRWNDRNLLFEIPLHKCRDVPSIEKIIEPYCALDLREISRLVYNKVAELRTKRIDYDAGTKAKFNAVMYYIYFTNASKHWSDFDRCRIHDGDYVYVDWNLFTNRNRQSANPLSQRQVVTILERLGAEIVRFQLDGTVRRAIRIPEKFLQSWEEASQFAKSTAHSNGEDISTETTQPESTPETPKIDAETTPQP